MIWTSHLIYKEIVYEVVYITLTFSMGDMIYKVIIPEFDSKGNKTQIVKLDNKYRASCLELTDNCYTIKDFTL